MHDERVIDNDPVMVPGWHSYSAELANERKNARLAVRNRLRVLYPDIGSRQAGRKKEREAMTYGTVRFGDEVEQCLMLPCLIMPGDVIWLPEEATARYCRAVHHRSGQNVARGSVAFYHGGRKDKGRRVYFWSLIDDALQSAGWRTL
jgi:hypothetical protein